MNCSPIFIDYLKSQSIKYIGDEIQQFELKIAEKELGDAYRYKQVEYGSGGQPKCTDKRPPVRC